MYIAWPPRLSQFSGLAKNLALPWFQALLARLMDM
jgi:hypothetical protein